MSAGRDTGGTAFPVDQQGMAGVVHRSPGMTLRDHFAGLAMQGLVAPQHADLLPFVRELLTKAVAECSYELADAMLKARSA